MDSKLKLFVRQTAESLTRRGLEDAYVDVCERLDRKDNECEGLKRDADLLREELRNCKERCEELRDRGDQ